MVESGGRQRHDHREVVRLLHVLGIDRPQSGGAEQALLGVEDAIQRVDDVVGAERLAVVELDPVVQLDRPLGGLGLDDRLRQAVVRELVVVVVGDERLPARGQPRLVGLGDDALAVDDVARTAAGDTEAEVPAPLRGAGRRGAAAATRARPTAAATGGEAARQKDAARAHQEVAARQTSVKPHQTVAGLVHHRCLLPRAIAKRPARPVTRPG